MSRVLFWPHRAQVAAATLVVAGAAVCLGLLALRDAMPGTGASGADPVAFMVDINQADQARLSALPGVGAAIAERIIAERLSRGPFVSVADLSRVKGVSARTLRRLGPFARVGEPLEGDGR